jgi:hypothetical protein
MSKTRLTQAELTAVTHRLAETKAENDLLIIQNKKVSEFRCTETFTDDDLVGKRDVRTSRSGGVCLVRSGLPYIAVAKGKAFTQLMSGI